MLWEREKQDKQRKQTENHQRKETWTCNFEKKSLIKGKQIPLIKEKVVNFFSPLIP